MDIHFDKDTIYCKYHRSFEKKETCKKYCKILCKSNGRAIEDYQSNEEEYKKILMKNLTLTEDNDY